ncbi:MAG: polysaccharide biosynthesis protein, partial [Planctomycetaceae bacterium]|nr:polysaccharide biosynthesis protein [Planctomycetaceae bacterium]
MIVRKNHVRHLLLLLLDGGIGALCLLGAMALRYEGDIPRAVEGHLRNLLPVVAGARILASLILRLHRWSFRHSGLTDGSRVLGAGLLGSGLFVMVVFVMRLPEPPRSVILIEFLLSTMVMAGLRFSPRLAWMYLADREVGKRSDALTTVILGAGTAGEALLRDLRQSRAHNFRVVGFLDDDRAKWGMVVGGLAVQGGLDELPRVAVEEEVRHVLIAIPRLPAARLREILDRCSDLSLTYKILPLSFRYLDDRVSAAMLQDLTPEDLLPRAAVDLAEGGHLGAIAGKVVLVTGAAGSIGSEICRQLLASGVARIVMVDMNENGLYLLQRRFEREFPGRAVEAEVADIRDEGRIRGLFAKWRPRDVFHAAAHKHVPLLETAPGEAVKNNVLGTLHLARAADAAGAERFLYISTDKAVRPSSVMGATKRVGEMVVRDLGRRSRTRFCAVRFGNVLGSAGSVVPLFREQIAAGGPVTVTDPEVRRYFMTIGEAVGLVLKAGYGDHGDLCVLDMGEPIRIVDLARQMITMAGRVPDVDIPLRYTGLRPGEKLTEELLTEEEERTHRVTEKIFAADSPLPPTGLEAGIEELARAAAREDGDAVRAALPDERI